MDFVGGVGVPDDELAVLRCRDEVSSVCRPMHGVNLGQVTLERPLGLHQLVLRDWLMSLLSDGAYWIDHGGLVYGTRSKGGVGSLLVSPIAETRTGGVGELILLSLDPVLESLCFATRLLNARLHCLRRHLAGAL